MIGVALLGPSETEAMYRGTSQDGGAWFLRADAETCFWSSSNGDNSVAFDGAMLHDFGVSSRL